MEANDVPAFSWRTVLWSICEMDWDILRCITYVLLLLWLWLDTSLTDRQAARQGHEDLVDILVRTGAIFDP